MARCVQDEDEFHRQYLGVARNVLELFPFLQRSGVMAAVMPDPLEACEAMSDMLPSPASVFTTEYFGRPVFSLKVLFKIAELLVLMASRTISWLMCSSETTNVATRAS